MPTIQVPLSAALIGNITGILDLDTSQFNITIVNGGGGEAGILRRASATLLSFLPFKGDKLPLNGAFATIPAAGLPGGGNASVFVNGVAAQSLVANTTYYVYAFDNAGTPTIGFRSDGVGHITGSGGIEVRASAVGVADNTHTLLGMIRTNASAQFVDAYTQRFLRSWFNQGGIVSSAKVGNPASVPQNPGSLPKFYELVLNGQATDPPTGTPVRANFLSWAGEVCSIEPSGEAHNEGGAGHIMIGASFNGVLQLEPTGQYLVPLVGGRGQFEAGGTTEQWSWGGADSVDNLPEGLNYASLWGESETGLGHFGGIDPYRARVLVQTKR